MLDGDDAELGGKNHAVPSTFEEFSEYRFGLSVSIGTRRIEKRHARVVRRMQGAQRLPASYTTHHGRATESERGGLQSAVT
jgi:hypothetical protein